MKRVIVFLIVIAGLCSLASADIIDALTFTLAGVVEGEYAGGAYNIGIATGKFGLIAGSSFLFNEDEFYDKNKNNFVKDIVFMMPIELKLFYDIFSWFAIGAEIDYNIVFAPNNAHAYVDYNERSFISFAPLAGLNFLFFHLEGAYKIDALDVSKSVISLRLGIRLADKDKETEKTTTKSTTPKSPRPSPAPPSPSHDYSWTDQIYISELVTIWACEDHDGINKRLRDVAGYHGKTDLWLFARDDAMWCEANVGKYFDHDPALKILMIVKTSNNPAYKYTVHLYKRIREGDAWQYFSAYYDIVGAGKR
jgi:hypothetical protein